MREAGVSGSRCEQRGEPKRCLKLLASFKRHRPGTIYDNVHVRTDFLAIQLHDQLVGPSIRAPVDSPQIITRLILAMVPELERAARAIAQVKPASAHRNPPRRGEHKTASHSFPGHQVALLIVIHNVRVQAFRVPTLVGYCSVKLPTRKGTTRLKSVL